MPDSKKTVVSFTPEFWNGQKFISKLESGILTFKDLEMSHTNLLEWMRALGL